MRAALEAPLSWLRSLSGVRREALYALLALLAGVLLLPLLVWSAGRLALGTYANGGPFALLADFARGLAQGSMPYWIVALAPYAAFIALRVLLRLHARAGGAGLSASDD